MYHDRPHERDAVLRFIGDTTQLDTAFDSVGDKATKGLKPAADALDGVQDGFKDAGKAGEDAADTIEDAGARTTSSVREARGEVALLGEEFGVRLPRHVRSFVAELPGVGEALTAAFSATAVLFIIQALVGVSEKLSNLIATQLIFTAAMKASDASVVETNKLFEALGATYAKDKKALDEFGKSATELSQQKLVDLNDRMKESISLQHQLDQQAKTTQTDYSTWGAVVDAVASKFGLGTPKLAAALDAQQAKVDELKAKAAAELRNQQNIALEQQLQEKENLRQQNDIALKAAELRIKLEKDTQEAIINLTEAKANQALVLVKGNELAKGQVMGEAAQMRYELELHSLQQQLAAEEKYGHDNLDKVKELNAQIEALQANHSAKTIVAFTKLQEALLAIRTNGVQEISASVKNEISEPLVDAFNKGTEAAERAGVTLRVNLVQALNDAKKAAQDFLDSGLVDPVAWKQFQSNIAQAQKNLDNFGKAEDRLKLKSETTFKGLVQDIKQGVNVTHELADSGQQLFNSFSSGLQNAFAVAISGEGSFGKAIEQATAKALDSLAAQAAVKALFYTAEGFAALAGFAAGPAAEYFNAAGIMAAVAGAAGTAGHLLGGAGGASGAASSTQFQSGSVEYFRLAAWNNHSHRSSEVRSRWVDYRSNTGNHW